MRKWNAIEQISTWLHVLIQRKSARNKILGKCREKITKIEAMHEYICQAKGQGAILMKKLQHWKRKNIKKTQDCWKQNEKERETKLEDTRREISKPRLAKNHKVLSGTSTLRDSMWHWRGAIIWRPTWLIWHANVSSCYQGWTKRRRIWHDNASSYKGWTERRRIWHANVSN